MCGEYVYISWEERLIWFGFGFGLLPNLGKILILLWQILWAHAVLAWNEINSQGGKIQEYCITEYYSCSDEGAIGLETH